ncbi:MAG TPA: SirB2 family protein [Steroidobacteraceae bacterium]|nr:SirB2 family protein [Steroidobacteraceae bacterium]
MVRSLRQRHGALFFQDLVLTLSAHYLDILHLHVACVALSGTLFSARGLLRIADSSLANHRILRLASYAIDTTLLAAALLLTAIVHQYPFVNGWLTVKVLLLVVYIFLGVIALKRARTRLGRTLALLGALGVFLAIVGVAITHTH